MSGPKCTPGPWTARRCGSGWAIDFNEDQEQVVDHVYEDGDAYKIAAAPELFESLEWALGIADEHVSAELSAGGCGPGMDELFAKCRAARAALAKARGEPQ